MGNSASARDGSEENDVTLHVDAKTDDEDPLPWLTAEMERDALQVAQTLEERSGELDPSHGDRWMLLCHAVRTGQFKVVAEVLATRPELSRQVDACRKALLDRDSNTAVAQVPLPLHGAALLGHDEVVAQLLASTPKLAQTVDGYGRTALHVAAMNGHGKVVAQLLRTAGSGVAVKVVDSLGQTALHCVFNSGFYYEFIAEMLLDADCELAKVVDCEGNTALHLAVVSGCSATLIGRLVRLNPDALRASANDVGTPFHAAVAAGDESVIELLQWKLTIEEILNDCHSSLTRTESLRVVLMRQCDPLLVCLNQDVVGTVFEYLGLECVKRTAAFKMTSLESSLLATNLF